MDVKSENMQMSDDTCTMKQLYESYLFENTPSIWNQSIKFTIGKSPHVYYYGNIVLMTYSSKYFKQLVKSNLATPTEIDNLHLLPNFDLQHAFVQKGLQYVWLHMNGIVINIAPIPRKNASPMETTIWWEYFETIKNYKIFGDYFCLSFVTQRWSKELNTLLTLCPFSILRFENSSSIIDDEKQINENTNQLSVVNAYIQDIKSVLKPEHVKQYWNDLNAHVKRLLKQCNEPNCCAEIVPQHQGYLKQSLYCEKCSASILQKCKNHVKESTENLNLFHHSIKDLIRSKLVPKDPHINSTGVHRNYILCKQIPQIHNLSQQTKTSCIVVGKLYFEYNKNQKHVMMEFNSNLQVDYLNFTDYFLQSREISISEMNIHETVHFSYGIKNILKFCSANNLTYHVCKNIKDLLNS